jgi:ATP-dependent Clp protease protease subunit
MNKLNEEKEKDQQPPVDLSYVFSTALDRPELRVSGIYGDIEESKCSETIYGLLSLHNTGKELVRSDETDPDSEMIETVKPIDFYISTYGGSAVEMFSVFDVMRSIRDETPIHTYGVGKVMSAGVLLLAAGTKGKRHIGKHCRLMIHGVVAGHSGYLKDMENEFQETKMTQKIYIRALAAETDMSEAYVRRMMNKKKNIYLDAEEAIKLGIADIII